MSPLTRISLSNPVAVAVAVILALIFGAISLGRLPIQMIPEVERPRIGINTSWRAAAPEEIESEIIEPQEEVFRGLPGLVLLESSASQGNGSISLTFAVGTDMREALIEVMNRLNRVPTYPTDALQPIVSTGAGDRGGAIAWFALRTLPGNERSIESYQEYVEEVIQARFERVPGVAQSNAFGGRQREVRITFDPYRAASYGIQLPQVIQLIGGNTDTSAGVQDVGRRAYTVRYAGGYTAAQLEDLIVDWRDGNPIYLRDVATVELRMVDRRGAFRMSGEMGMAVNAQPATGVNVLDVMAGLKDAAVELRVPLERAGLQMEQVYDETLYITNSISMVRTNLLLGVLLAIGILWWFLRRFRATLMVALAIPVSLLLTFTLLDATGRTLNIISLAGLAFAVGMTLDAAIVVLENIVRLREEGKSPREAALLGTGQVWGALLASTATTVAIFLPVVFLEDVAGQLFADLALTIAAAVTVALLIAITVLPTSAATWLKKAAPDDPHAHWWRNGSDWIMRLTDGPKRRWGWIGGLITIPVIVALLLLPRADYLPTGNQNFIFSFLLPPPGASAALLEDEMVQPIVERMQPFLDGTREPKVESYFLGVFGRTGFMGVRAANDGDVSALQQVLNREIYADFPDTIAFANRASIFGRVAGGRNIDVNIQSRDIDALLDAANIGFITIPQVLPGARVQPVPSLDLAEPELRLIPDERRIAEAGWNRRTVAGLIRAFGSGLYLGDYFDGDQRLDVILRATSWDSPEELASYPVATPNSGVQPLGALVSLERTAGPDQIRRVDRRRTITLRVTPPEAVSLEETIEALEEQVQPIIQRNLPEDGTISYRGTADDLRTALRSMAGSFALAIVLLYLLISALFQSFRDSVLVIMAIPLATVGGVLALRVVNLITFQPMDLLTMIGFIVLLGLVVNNAILLVYQTRNAEREGLARRDAVRQAVRLRLRPILMSTMTSLFGMLPLLVIPGAGTEVYRGMAAVIVGGLSVSTVFTLVLLPSLLRIGEEKHAAEIAPVGEPAMERG
ncbi:MAG: efflux RND transporter permease subunit [Xanthomonadaceae bacterium]|nr:efflux RND transporter permease subunit [Xanthomonadaceae bacterium]